LCESVKFVVQRKRVIQSIKWKDEEFFQGGRGRPGRSDADVDNDISKTLRVMYARLDAMEVAHRRGITIEVHDESEDEEEVEAIRKKLEEEPAPKERMTKLIMNLGGRYTLDTHVYEVRI
jgi:predicted urease superfamily metal-dependent hydrolase